MKESFNFSFPGVTCRILDVFGGQLGDNGKTLGSLLMRLVGCGRPRSCQARCALTSPSTPQPPRTRALHPAFDDAAIPLVCLAVVSPPRPLLSPTC
eukprot:1275226-Amphidinium_carterae.2